MNVVLSNIKNSFAHFLTFILMIVMNSCVTENAECPLPEETDKDGIHLRFTIMTKSDARTRAADLSGDEEGTASENYLNVNDVKYLLFDKDKNYLLELPADTKTIAANSSFTVYNVEANITDEYFLDNLNGIIDFYILVLANSSGWNVNMPDLSRGSSMTTLFDNGYVMSELPETGKLLNAASTDENSKQFFPMSGLQRYTVPGSMLMTSAEGAPYDLSLATGKDVNLLRSLAKIEIIDKINITEGGVFDDNIDNVGEKGMLRIDKVELDGYINQGALLPLITQWDCNSVFETQQVRATSIPTSAEYLVPPILNSDGSFGESTADNYSVSFQQDPGATAMREDKCPVFSCYVYEYSRLSDQLLNIPQTQQPYFRVTTRGYTDENGEVRGESMIFPVRMAAYNNGVAGENLGEMMRNHIYRFEIVGIGQNISVNWTVCEMDKASSNIEFN